MLRKIRITVAVACLTLITLLFLDFTGTCARWFGWLAKIQLLPALMALNAGIIVGLVLFTLVFGRIYCSIICPLGVMQDCFAALGKRAKKNRYRYSQALNTLRYTMLALMALAIVFGISAFVALLAPYSAYGRIAQTILSPIWLLGNSLLARWAEAEGSYTFYNVDIWLRGWVTLGVASATLIILGILAWRNGRTYCNTICPVGTVLGFLSRFSLLKPTIDTSKCNACGLCARNCKAACIDSKLHKIDYSRCVTCFDCIDKCHQGAISYTFRHKATQPTGNIVDTSRRRFLGATAMAAVAGAIEAEEKIIDGGLAAIEEKKKPLRRTPIVPPGSQGLKHLTHRCTACQLCVAACPNGVLRPSTDMSRLMQPESSYERGYCRPECTRCSEVCPTGAIIPIDRAEKSSIQVGHAVWIKSNCVVLTDGVACDNCARHCPSGAITMVPSNPANEDSPKIPAIDSERCIGCGACENLCPARPFSAIYVEGHERHRTI